MDETELLEARQTELLAAMQEPITGEQAESVISELAEIETALNKVYSFMGDVSDSRLCARFGTAL